ncbi:tannase/feruloyl esterase family alpha/beta hydrolase [Paraburkholderia hospita]|uniref:tannase/feruloyl esterase family alpha/beta hydrolase n=1 Tax=Paraburkholderia hospita TaxID=169430 RepID=UPI000B344F76|nr:tannase/feruloyl esterase family alpha/beta hydrolase [Paraburkholderia hospita]OUL82443.1 tannase/feruloyl esterase family alpha/beta hydrolase [Paraburkholderia hospita]
MKRGIAWPRAALRLARTALLCCAASTATAATPETQTPTAPKQPPFATRCTDLNDLWLDAETIALPTHGAHVESATVITAQTPGNGAGEFCRITGVIRAIKGTTPDIRFDLNLPRRWNGRALQVGGGGYNGTVVTGIGVMPFSPIRAPLGQGYVTFGDDSGHVGNSSLAVFGLVDEAVVNFGYAHLKKTHDAALALIVRMYGHPADRMYFAGGSTGGREGYTVMQRFPDDYDGVIADSPALNFSGVRLIGVRVGQAEYATPGGFVPPALLERVYQRSVEVCDKLDGATDGIVSDVAECRQREPEIIDALRCHRGTSYAHEGGCLTDAQLSTLNILRDGLRLPYKLAYDVSGYHGYNVFQGTRLNGMLGLGRDPVRQTSPTFTGNGYLFAQADGYIRYFVTQDATFDSIKFDVQHPGKYQKQLITLSQIIGATNPDLGRFIAKGGKLITMQGLADEVISPNQTIAYYDRLVDLYGDERVNAFMRLYMVPGFQHGGGVFIPSVDLLGALDSWVTRGISPETLLATDISPPTNGRSRPLCRYPMYPRYLGKGNLNEANNFVCSEP